MSKEYYDSLVLSSNESHILGLDEVGYGALAGSLVVCGVKAPKDWNLEGLNDSKKLSPKKREAMELKLKELVNKGIITFYMADFPNTVIDSLGMAVALKKAYAECIADQAKDNIPLILADGVINLKAYVSHPVTTIVKGDTIVPTIMAASILAKTYRDKNMHELHELHPQYDWISNVGYGAPKHLAAIKTIGPCPLHRFSYAPMSSMTKQV